MRDPHYSVRPQNGRHPIRAKKRRNGEGHITAVRNDLPGIVAHTAAGGPKRARGSVTSTGLDLRKRIPFDAVRRFLRRAADQKPNFKTIRRTPAIAGIGKLLDLDLGTGLFELLLNRRGLVLVDAFLDGLWSAV